LNVEIDGARSFVIAFNFFFYELSKYMKYMEKNNRFEMIEKNEIEIIAKLIMGMRDKLLAKVNGNLPQEDKLIHVTRQFIEMSRTADNLYLQLETEKKIKKLNNATLYDILLELIRRIK
jgi:hypothetical protein